MTREMWLVLLAYLLGLAVGAWWRGTMREK